MADRVPRFLSGRLNTDHRTTNESGYFLFHFVKITSVTAQLEVFNKGRGIIKDT